MDKKSLELPWNIFVPHQIQNEHSSYLIGEVKEQQRVICIHGLYHSNSNFSPNIIGIWKPEESKRIVSEPIRPSCCKNWVSLLQKEDGYISASLEMNVIPDFVRNPPVVCILFSLRDILSSVIFAEVHPYKSVLNTNIDKLTSGLDSVYNQSNKEEKAAILSQSFNESLKTQKSNDSYIFGFIVKKNYSPLTYMLPYVLTTFLYYIGQRIQSW